MCAEFDCCECHVHVISYGSDRPPEPPLCAACLMLPGWMSDPKLCGTIGRYRTARGRRMGELPEISFSPWPRGNCGND